MVLQDYTSKTVAKVEAEDISLVEGPWLDTDRLFYRSRTELFVVEGLEQKERLLCSGFHPIAKNGQNIFRGQRLFLAHDRELSRVAGNSYLPNGNPSLVFVDATRQQRRETDLEACFTSIAGLEVDLAQRHCVVVGSSKRNASISVYCFDQSLAHAVSCSRAFEQFGGVKRFPQSNTLVVSGKNSLYVYCFAPEGPRPSLELLSEFKLNATEEVSDFVFLKQQLLVSFEGRRDLALIDISQPQQKYDPSAALVQELVQLGVRRTCEEQVQPPAAGGEPSLALERTESLTLPAGNLN